MVDMLIFRVTNTSQSERVWQSEPYGDEVALSPGDVLEVHYECTLTVVLEVYLHAGADVTWCDLGGDTVVPTALTRNGQSMWRPPT